MHERHQLDRAPVRRINDSAKLTLGASLNGSRRSRIEGLELARGASTFRFIRHEGSTDPPR